MDRYNTNLETVKKIAEILGYEIISFDPDWTFGNKFSTDSYEHRTNTLTDELMGRLAITLGYEWEFRVSFEQRKERIVALIESNEKLANIARNNITQSKIQKHDENWDMYTTNCLERIKNCETNLKIHKAELEFFENIKGVLK